MLIGKKGRIKSYLMNQHNISGIGNVYIQDILFKAGIHPNRKIKDITETELAGLYKAITGHLQYAVELGGLVYEHDFYGQKGRYTYDLIGHRPGSPCPICGTIIKEIKCGSTRSFICEKCQQ
jgi:formamidopyrimidine-DNA glycosylase